MLNKKCKIVIAFLAISILFTGCGQPTPKEKELAEFSSAVEEFTSEIKSANDDINAIDTESEHASEELLTILDLLEETFQELSEVTVPDYYKAIEELADEAYDNMSNAVTFYHTAYETDPFSQTDADIAYQYYTRAMTRVTYIGYVLTGDIPEGENITVYEKPNEDPLINQILHSTKDEE